MVVCAVTNCLSRSQPSSHGGKHFFRFPKENDKSNQIRTLWIQFTRRGSSFDPKNSAICEDHFTPNCFIQKKKGRLYLHKNSVPTIYYRESKQKLEKIEIPYDCNTQEYINADSIDYLYATTNAEREQEILLERQTKIQSLQNLCRFCFECDKDIKCVPINKLEAYQIDVLDFLKMIGIVIQHNDTFSEIICEKCFQQIIDIDSYRKRCQKAQSDIIAELEELDQKIEEIQNTKKQENPWFKVEIIETNEDNIPETEVPHFEIIEEEHLEEADVIYEDGCSQYQSGNSYIQDYSNKMKDDDTEEEEGNNKEIYGNDVVGISESVEQEDKKCLLGKNDNEMIFNEKDKYNIVDKEAIIKNPDRNINAYRIYECFFCRLKFAGRKTYKAHDCQVKEVKCEVEGCSKIFTKQSGYNQHIVKIHGHLKKSKKYCPICKQYLNASESQFKSHCKQCSKESMKKEQIIECEICNKKCKNLKSYVVHKMFHDARNLVKVNDESGSKKAPIFSGKGPVICELCGKEFTNSQGLRTHKKNVHLVGSKGEVYQCDICNKERPSKRSLFNHMRNVHRVQKTPCNVCEKVFRTKALLQKHMMYHDETKRIHFCPLCPDKPGYFTGVALRRHQKSHHVGLKEYQCDLDYCDASFNSTTLLKQHKMQQHGVNLN